jgi:hypothetical protein
MHYDVQIPHSEDDNRTRRASVTVSKLPEAKSNKGINEKQRTVIEFLLLKGCAGEEIVIRLRNVCRSVVYCRVSVFRCIGKGCRGNEEPRHEGRMESHIGTILMR